MSKRDPRVDQIIEGAPPFARPVLKRLRTWVHRYCPTAVESIKWGHAAFLYRDRILCGVAVFKAHCTFGFWHPMMRRKLKGPGKGQFGKMTSVNDLPAEAAFAEMVREAMRLEDEGVKPPPRKTKTKPPAAVPDDLADALHRSAAAAATFTRLSPSCRREYIEWITEARRTETRQRRLATTLDYLADGKSLNWKYQR